MLIGRESNLFSHFIPNKIDNLLNNSNTNQAKNKLDYSIISLKNSKIKQNKDIKKSQK